MVPRFLPQITRQCLVHSFQLPQASQIWVYIQDLWQLLPMTWTCFRNIILTLSLAYSLIVPESCLPALEMWKRHSAHRILGLPSSGLVSQPVRQTGPKRVLYSCSMLYSLLSSASKFISGSCPSPPPRKVISDIPERHSLIYLQPCRVNLVGQAPLGKGIHSVHY